MFFVFKFNVLAIFSCNIISIPYLYIYVNVYQFYNFLEYLLYSEILFNLLIDSCFWQLFWKLLNSFNFYLHTSRIYVAFDWCSELFITSSWFFASVIFTCIVHFSFRLFFEVFEFSFCDSFVLLDFFGDTRSVVNITTSL